MVQVVTGEPLMAALAASGLFDAAGYLARNPDVAAAGMDPLAHYCSFGWREGRWPNLLFDPGWYLRASPDVAQTGLEPLLHYFRRGEREGRRPVADFDPIAYRASAGLAQDASILAHVLAACAAAQDGGFDRVHYLHTYPDRGAPGLDPLAHYVAFGRAEGRSPRPEPEVAAASGLFEPSYYLIVSQDVRGAGLDPIEHFCRTGWREGRNPNLYFNTAWYRRTHADALRPDVNPLMHYVLTGEQHGLLPCPHFVPDWYRQHYRLPAAEPALRHYLRNRRSQLFSPNPDFDVAAYVAAHRAAIGPNRDPFVHFLRHRLAATAASLPGLTLPETRV